MVLKLALFTLFACSSLPDKPLQVVITKPVPWHQLPACHLLQPPDPPSDIVLNVDDPNVIIRTSTNYAQHNALLGWARDMMVWTASVIRCFDQIGGAE